MKKVLLPVFVFFFSGMILLMPSCKKDKDPFDEDSQKSYEAVIELQNKSLQKFNEFLITQDTTGAKESVATWFKGDALVEWATVTAQGVMVKYVSGICGGLVVDYQRKPEIGKPLTVMNQTLDHPIPYKLTSKKKAVILAAFYDSWSSWVDYQKNNWDVQLARDGFPSTERVTNKSVTLDKLTTLNQYGVIDFNTHGIIWPAGNAVDDIAMLTYEIENISTAKKYWKDLQEGRVVILEDPTGFQIYAVKPDFITQYNDFKKDTVLFYGGFCYSGLGHWPDIVKSCAAGTYLGVNNPVQSDWASWWAVDVITSLSDHSLDYPMTMEYWQMSSPLAKKYWSADLRSDVVISYTGYGGLTLWKNEDASLGSIKSTDTSGAPVKIPGYTCQNYVLECDIPGVLPAGLGYSWTYGDGQTYYTVNDNKALKHHWANQKSYTVSVEVRKISTNEVIKQFIKTVSFVEPSYLPELQTFKFFKEYLVTNGIQLSGAGGYGYYFDTNTEYYETPLTWTDSSFLAKDMSNYDHLQITVEGNFSSDGRILKHCLIRKTRSKLYPPEMDLTLEITNFPIMVRDTMNCLSSFYNSMSGTAAQPFATRVEYKEWNAADSTWTTISNIDWTRMGLTTYFTNDH
ncbi:MAG: hypothetical protein NTV01_10695 [Bacteroidia bacterium]|nr:hypothetical protein [Bacteroidia bacterium]